MGFGGVLGRLRASRWGAYFAKGFALVVLLWLACRVAPLLPAPCVALLWAALSAVAALGVAHRLVVRKMEKQFRYEGEGRLSKLNDGRALRFVGAFAVSAVCAAGLLLDLPKWGVAEWFIAVAGVPLFPAVHFLVDRLLRKELKPLFRESLVTIWSAALVGVLLIAAYVAALFLEPAATYASAAEAFLAAGNPFVGSASALLGEVGDILALVDGLSAYGLSAAAETSFGAYLLWRILLSASAFFAFAAMLGTCSLQMSEVRRVFAPLQTDDATPVPAPARRHVLAAGVLPVVLLAVFAVMELGAAQAAESGELSAAKRFVRTQVAVSVCVIDDKYYDPQVVQELFEKPGERMAALLAEAETDLVPLINEAHDRRIANVDGYLDWYYSLSADYERLAQFFTGTIEEGMREQLAAHLDEGVDDARLESLFASYAERMEALQAESAAENLPEYELVGIPEWLIESKEVRSFDELAEPYAPAQDFLSGYGHMGVSVGAGIVSGIAAKAVFNKLVGKLTGSLASKGLARAVGGIGGTLVAPGVGTAAGVAAGVAVDYLFVKADEQLNRESYRAELVEAIEESRTQMLALVQPTTQ